MHYLAYHFTVAPPQPGSEILVALIADMGFESFDYNENGFTAYIQAQEAQNVNFDELTFDDFTYTWTIESISKTNWNEEWEKNFEPVVVGDKLCIRAAFHTPNSQVKNEIIITPKMSFGTGHHQTTQLMCEAMFEDNFADKRVLDMGCGTGVLAILAEMLGATDILAVDIDEWSVENSRENCAVNNALHITVKKGDVDALAGERPFDIIIANINKNILKVQIPVYSSKLKSGGHLFLSGFFETDSEDLTTYAITYDLKFRTKKSKDGWCMLILEKQDK